MRSPATPRPEAPLVIAPGSASAHYWRDLWRYRELLLILGWRDVAVRYKQSLVGVAWALLRPLLTMLIFTVLFGRLANLPSERNIPYGLLVLAGMLPWYLFASALSTAGDSMVLNASLIGKVYFPRAIVPASALVTALVDFAVGLAVLLGAMVWYRYAPGWQLVLLPAIVLVTILATLGPSLWIAALGLKYRDIRHIVPFLVQLGIYVSPVGFSSALVPGPWRALYSLNPMVGIIDVFRWSVLAGQSSVYLPGVMLSLLVVAFFMWLGVTRFRATERHVADLI